MVLALAVSSFGNMVPWEMLKNGLCLCGAFGVMTSHSSVFFLPRDAVKKCFAVCLT